jgi:hypothetical protein
MGESKRRKSKKDDQAKTDVLQREMDEALKDPLAFTPFAAKQLDDPEMQEVLRVVANRAATDPEA